LKFGQGTPWTGNVSHSVSEQKVVDQWFLS
jgi:hypothetical protein